jgi:hypothetical protein
MLLAIPVWRRGDPDADLPSGSYVLVYDLAPWMMAAATIEALAKRGQSVQDIGTGTTVRIDDVTISRQGLMGRICLHVTLDGGWIGAAIALVAIIGITAGTVSIFSASALTEIRKMVDTAVQPISNVITSPGGQTALIGGTLLGLGAVGVVLWLLLRKETT